jgi:hypothetical protein
MRISAVSILATCLALALSSCAKEEAKMPVTASSNEVTLRELATQKTVAQAEAFAADHKLPFSKQTIEVMRRQAEQIPSSALGADGRVWVTLHLTEPETTAHVYFYHDKGGYVISTIIHLEPVNKP